MSLEEKLSRMSAMRKIVSENTIFWWVDSFLRASLAKKLQDFPTQEEYIPVIKDY